MNIVFYIHLDTFNWCHLRCQNCQLKYWRI